MKSFEHLLLGKLFVHAKRASGGQGNLNTHGLIDMNCIAWNFFCWLRVILIVVEFQWSWEEREKTIVGDVGLQENYEEREKVWSNECGQKRDWE